MLKRDLELISFITESNKIENIFREPTYEEISEFERFLILDKITVDELIKFVSVYQPDAKLRDQYNMNVRIGNYYPPFGSPEIRDNLISLLETNYDAYDLHVKYEKLHPFTDGNGRSGRALWAWKMKDISDGFLRPFYYQTLRKYHG